MSLRLQAGLCAGGIALLVTSCGPVPNQQDSTSSLHGDSGISRPGYETIINIFGSSAESVDGWATARA